MTHYEKLLAECESLGLQVMEVPLTKAKGFIYGSIIGIEPSLSEAQKGVILAEELEHYRVNVGNITDLRKAANRKQERRARRRVYLREASPVAIVNAYKAGARTYEDFCDALDVPPEFLAEALAYYDEATGPQGIGPYRLSFKPFNIEEV